MKKYLLLAAVSFTFASCNDSTVNVREVDQRYKGCNIEVITFEGCEYVNFGSMRNSAWGGHKGNCKNPVHYPQTIKTDTE